MTIERKEGRKLRKILLKKEENEKLRLQKTQKAIFDKVV